MMVFDSNWIGYHQLWQFAIYSVNIVNGRVVLLTFHFHSFLLPLSLSLCRYLLEDELLQWPILFR